MGKRNPLLRRSNLFLSNAVNSEPGDSEIVLKEAWSQFMEEDVQTFDTCNHKPEDAAASSLDALAWLPYGSYTEIEYKASCQVKKEQLNVARVRLVDWQSEDAQGVGWIQEVRNSCRELLEPVLVARAAVENVMLMRDALLGALLI